LHNAQMIYGTAGTYNLTFTATAMDTSGNTNSATRTMSVTIDSIASTAANEHAGTAGDDSQSFNAENTGRYFSGFDGNDTFVAGSGSDLMYGGAGNDNLTGGAGNDVIRGGIGNDTLNGGNGNDLLFGELGADNLIGNESNDILYGGLANDTLSGGAGNDFLIGGQGNDTMTGGTGIDTFMWMSGDDAGKATDTITDFKANPVGTSTSASILNLSDLLTGEHADANSLDSYLNITASGSSTTIKVDPSGAGDFSNASASQTQTIVLQGVNLTTVFATTSSHDIINHLITNGNLIVDH